MRISWRATKACCVGCRWWRNMGLPWRRESRRPTKPPKNWSLGSVTSANQFSAACGISPPIWRSKTRLILRPRSDRTLVDGFKIADEIRRSDPIAFEVLSTVKVPAHYLGDGVHLRGEHPVIGLDHNGDVVQIAYNNYDRAP